MRRHFSSPSSSARPTALFLSPHLDDVAFSCGGAVVRLARAGWQTVLATVFTQSVSNPTGFALQCQTSKGIAARVDYMALRRHEDAACAERLGVSSLVWLDFAEAPHRGYTSPEELFGAALPEQDLIDSLTHSFSLMVAEYRPTAVFLPQALGYHIDHRLVVQAALQCPELIHRAVWYFDTPYVIRHPGCEPPLSLPSELELAGFDLGEIESTKLAAMSCYASQLDFQFGGPVALQATMRKFHRQQGAVFSADEPVEPVLLSAVMRQFLQTRGLLRSGAPSESTP